VTRRVSEPRIELLTESHDRDGFSCEKEQLTKFLRERALRDMRSKTSATRVLLLESKVEIVGYYTLTAASVSFDKVPDAIRKRIKLTKYPTTSATLLARLARDIRWRGRGIGELLVIDALRRAYNQTAHIGAALILVDAIDDEAAEFYQAFGFTAFPEKRLELFMPMAMVETLVNK